MLVYLADWRMDLCLFDAGIYLSVQGTVANTGSSHLGGPPRVRPPKCTSCFATGVRRMGPATTRVWYVAAFGHVVVPCSMLRAWLTTVAVLPLFPFPVTL